MARKNFFGIMCHQYDQERIGQSRLVQYKRVYFIDEDP